jgi:deoxyribodipyrimidine photolyase
MQKKGIYWFTTDLRLDDNPALKMAVEAMDQLIFVYSADTPESSLSFASRLLLFHKTDKSLFRSRYIV